MHGDLRAVDSRAAQVSGGKLAYTTSLRIRKGIKKSFGWIKTTATRLIREK